MRKYIETENKINYIVYYPEKFSDNMPLLLFLHGIGERGNKPEKLEKYALPKYMNRFDIPYIVVASQFLIYYISNYLDIYMSKPAYSEDAMKIYFYKGEL